MGPITLENANFNLAAANIDTTKHRDLLNSKILQLGFKQICAAIFKQPCPSYSDQPHAVIEHIRQSASGPDGQLIVVTVHEYFQRLQNASRPFAARKTLPIDLCGRFIIGLDRHLIPSFRRLYPNHANVHDLSSTAQRAKLPIIIAAAQLAEDEVHQLQDIARSVTGGQGFHIQVPPGVSTISTPPYIIPAYPSQAKRTLVKYKAPAKEPPTNPCIQTGCFGCKGPHPWMAGGKVICPHGNDPRVRANTDKEYTAYKKRCANRFRGRSDDRSGGKKKPRRSHPLDFTRFSAKTQTRMREGVLASNTAARPIAPANSPVVYMLTVPAWEAPQVFAATSVPHRRTLPVPISPAFPHIILELGSQLGDANNPAIHAVVDTAAALTTGNLHFFATIAKAYPYTIHAIYTRKDYSSITLSGIVEDINGASITTDLTVAFSFHLPYFMREGAPTTFLVAVGPNATVNTILGLPFIQQTKMIIDAADQVAELRSLDAPPFPIDFRHAQCGVPTISAKDPINASHFTDIIREIANIESLYSASKPCAPNPTISPAIKSNKRGYPGQPCLANHVTFSPATMLPPSVDVSVTTDDVTSEDSSDDAGDDIPLCP